MRSEQTSEREKNTKPPKDTTRPSDAPYSEIILHQVTKQVGLFQKRNYEVRITVGHGTNFMYPVTGVLDTGAGPNLISLNLIKPLWEIYMKTVKDPGLTVATKQVVTVGGAIFRHVCLGYLPFRVWLSLVDKLAVPVLLGTFYIDRSCWERLIKTGFVRRIFPQVTFHSTPVEILDEFSANVPESTAVLESKAKADTR